MLTGFYRAASKRVVACAKSHYFETVLLTFLTKEGLYVVERLYRYIEKDEKYVEFDFFLIFIVDNTFIFVL